MPERRGEQAEVIDLEQPRFVAACHVEVREVEWLWPGYVPLGKLTLLEGDPGLAKTTLALDLAARVTAGLPMPDGAEGMHGSAVFVGYEDDAADTIVPRFKAAGGDDRRFFLLESIYGSEGPRPVTLPDDVAHVEAVVRQVEARLLIVDPLMAAIGMEVKTGIDHHVRRVLAPVRGIAEQLRCAVLLIRHWNKDSKQGHLLYRGGGSIGIVGAARAAFAVGRDPEDPSRRVLVPVKSNLAPEAARKALRYRVVSHAETGAAVIEWLGTCDPEALARAIASGPSPTDTSAIGEAVSILTELLTDGPVLASDATKYMKEAGVAERTLDRATVRAGVRKRPLRDPKTGKKRWWWDLPKSAETGSSSA